MREINAMFGSVCALLAWAIVESLVAADLDLAAAGVFFLLAFVAGWIVARHRERTHLEHPPDG